MKLHTVLPNYITGPSTKPVSVGNGSAGLITNQLSDPSIYCMPIIPGWIPYVAALSSLIISANPNIYIIRHDLCNKNVNNNQEIVIYVKIYLVMHKVVFFFSLRLTKDSSRFDRGAKCLCLVPVFGNREDTVTFIAIGMPARFTAVACKMCIKKWKTATKPPFTQYILKGEAISLVSKFPQKVWTLLVAYSLHVVGIHRLVA